ncbi:MAG: hypothetical protein WAX04_12875 [Oscillospiraceae bacterium]
MMTNEDKEIESQFNTEILNIMFIAFIKDDIQYFSDSLSVGRYLQKLIKYRQIVQLINNVNCNLDEYKIIGVNKKMINDVLILQEVLADLIKKSDQPLDF